MTITEVDRAAGREIIRRLEFPSHYEIVAEMIAPFYAPERERVARMEKALAEAMIILKALSFGGRQEIAPTIMEEIDKLCAAYESALSPSPRGTE